MLSKSPVTVISGMIFPGCSVSFGLGFHYLCAENWIGNTFLRLKTFIAIAPNEKFLSPTNLIRIRL